MKRGEIYYVNLDPANQQGDIHKTRVLVVSNNANNKAASTLSIVPLMNNVNKVHPFEVLIEQDHSGLARAMKAQCHQVRTISKARLVGHKLGHISQELMQKIDNALRLHLSL
jgi:mRNA interferase MazF